MRRWYDKNDCDKYIRARCAVDSKKNHPAIFVDGMYLDGIERVEFTNHYLEKCEVVLTFNDRVETNPFPLNDITLLEKLFGKASNGQSLRDIVWQTLEDGN